MVRAWGESEGGGDTRGKKLGSRGFDSKFQFQIWGSLLKVQGLGLRVQSAGCRVQGAGCRVQGAGCRVQVAGCRVQVAGFRVQGFPCYIAVAVRKVDVR